MKWYELIHERIGLFGLMKLTLDSKTYKALGFSLRVVLMGLVLLFYVAVGCIVTIGTYMAVVGLLEGIIG